MLSRLLLVGLVVVALAGAIAYSKFRPVDDRVSGFVEADEIRLGSRLGGRVAEVLVEEGARIEAGQVLVRLEPFDLLAQQQQARAALAAAAAQWERLKAGLREEEVAQADARLTRLQARLDRLVAGPRRQEIDVARARLQMAEAQRRLAAETYARTSKLRESNAATQQDFDRAVESLQSAEGALTASREELSLLEAGTREEEIREVRARVEEARLAAQLASKGFRQEEIDAAKAEHDAAAAALAATDARIEELTIRSPVAGVVEALDVRHGDLAGAGAPILSIVDDNELWVRAYVPESRLDVSLDQPVAVTVDSYPDRKFAAKLTFIARQAEFTPSNVQTPEERVKQVFRIKATLAEGRDLLRPGMPADVWLGEGEEAMSDE